MIRDILTLKSSLNCSGTWSTITTCFVSIVSILWVSGDPFAVSSLPATVRLIMNVCHHFSFELVFDNADAASAVAVFVVSVVALHHLRWHLNDSVSTLVHAEQRKRLELARTGFSYFLGEVATHILVRSEVRLQSQHSTYLARVYCVWNWKFVGLKVLIVQRVVVGLEAEAVRTWVFVKTRVDKSLIVDRPLEELQVFDDGRFRAVDS